MAHKFSFLVSCFICALLGQSHSLASEEFKSFKIMYLFYDPRKPSEIEYTFFKNDLSSIEDCYEKLQEVLEIQKKKIEVFIEDHKFGNNWKLYGAEPYLVVNRNDSITQYYMCKGVN